MTKTASLMIFIATNLFYSMSVLMFVNRVLGEPKFHRRLVNIAYVLGYMSYLALFYFTNGTPAILMSFFEFAFPLGLALCYRSPIKKQLLIAATVIVLSIITQLATNLSLSLIDGSELFLFTALKANIFGVAARLLFFGLTQTLAAVFSKSRDLPMSYWICVMTFPLVSIIVVQTLYGFAAETSQYPIALICIVIILIMNLLVYYLYNRLAVIFADKSRQALLEQQVKYYLKQSEETALAWDEKKLLMHDQKHQLLAIDTYLIQKDYATLEQYVEKLLFQHTVGVSSTANPTLSAVVSYKTMQANKAGITIDADINVPCDLKLNAADFSVLLGNALDNAVRAAEDTESKKVRLTIQYQDKNMLLIISNPFNCELSYNETGELLSTKGEQRGFGMKSIQKIVDKYGGILTVSSEENMFTLKIVLYDLSAFDQKATTSA